MDRIPTMWVFGYGSLMWRPGFGYAERHPGFIRGWARRFYQGSPDHRGVPAAPGRVVTLVAAPGAACWGIAYRLPDGPGTDGVLAALDHREVAGYERFRTTFEGRDGRRVPDALVYRAGAGNPNYLGPAAPDAMARQIVGADGPSGANADYLFRLGAALAELGVEEPHISELEAAVRALSD